ncbi:MAG: GAF domain-containing protein [Syntrophotaleaceae bacterium]
MPTKFGFDEKETIHEEALHRQTSLLKGINRIFEEALVCETDEELGLVCLQVAEELTESRFGFIGMIGEGGLFDDIAISDPGWAVCKIEGHRSHRKLPTGFKVQGIYGRVLLDGKSFFTNDPSSHPDSIGLPQGHPPLDAFIGAPLNYGKKTIGLVALGNRQGGYREMDRDALDGLAKAMVQAFIHKHEQTARKKSEQRLAAELDIARRLQQTSTHLLQTDRIDSLYDQILDTALAILKADFATLQMFCSEQGEHGELRLLGHRGLPPDVDQAESLISPVSGAVCGKALDTGQRVIVPDIETCEFIDRDSHLDMCRKTGIRAIQCTPLVSRSGAFLGMIATHWSQPHDPLESELGALDILARQTADLLDRYRAEEALRESEERFRSLILASSDAVFRMGPDWREMCQLHGRKFLADTTEPCRSWLSKYIPTKDRRQVIAVMDEAIRTRSTFELVHRVLRSDGSVGWTFSRAIPLLDEKGRVVEWFGMAKDITERKEAEEALIKNEAKYRSLFENIDEGFCIMQMIFDDAGKPVDFRFLETNPAFEKHTGLIDAQGKTIRQLFPRHEEHWFEIYGRIALSGQAERFENWAEQLHRWFDLFAFRYGEPESRQVAVLFSDITERKKAEADIVEARKAAEEANQAKSAFLANMSHEIRTPMTVFLVALENLLQLERDPQHCRLLELADKSAKRLDALIDDILDFSRIEAGKIELADEPFDVRETVREVFDMFDLQAEKKNLRLITEVAEPVPRQIFGDRGKLGQILTNLIGNALKFTHEGEIRVKVGLREQSLEFSIADTGIGIPKDKCETIFESFTQADSSLTRQYGGTGLGLTISRGLVKLMGGEIWARPGEQGGSVFTFTLPLRIPVETAGNVREKKAFPRILVVDDDPMIRQMIILLLNQRGWQVDEAADGQEALQKYRTGQFELVLMDVQMPEMDGLEATVRIRQGDAEQGRRTTVIGLTAHGQKEVKDRCLSAGMDSILTKPIRMKDLFGAIEASLKS